MRGGAEGLQWQLDWRALWFFFISYSGFCSRGHDNIPDTYFNPRKTFTGVEATLISEVILILLCICVGLYR